MCSYVYLYVFLCVSVYVICVPMCICMWPYLYLYVMLCVSLCNLMYSYVCLYVYLYVFLCVCNYFMLITTHNSLLLLNHIYKWVKHNIGSICRNLQLCDVILYLLLFYKSKSHIHEIVNVCLSFSQNFDTVPQMVSEIWLKTFTKNCSFSML